MTTLWITKFPLGTTLRATGIAAVRDAMRLLAPDTPASAEEAYAAVIGRALPICVGASDDSNAVEAAGALLEAQGFTIGVDLAPEQVSELRTAHIAPADQEGQIEDYDFASAKAALVLLHVAQGNPVAALGVAAMLGAAFDETPDDPGSFFDAGLLLVETFSGGTHNAMVQAMTGGGLDSDPQGQR